MRRSSLPAAGFWGVALGAVSVAHACGGGPPDSICTVPGFGFFRPDLLVLFPILSGAIERPFYTLAGYRVATLGYSIQANLIASLVVGVGGFFGIELMWRHDAELLVVLGAPLLAMLLKLWWFNRVPRDERAQARVGWFIAATVLSTLVIASIPLWMHVFGTDRYSWAEKVMTLKLIASIATLLAAIAIHVTLFSRLKRNKWCDTRRGFEVLPAQSGETIPVARVI